MFLDLLFGYIVAFNPLNSTDVLPVHIDRNGSLMLPLALGHSQRDYTLAPFLFKIPAVFALVVLMG